MRIPESHLEELLIPGYPDDFVIQSPNLPVVWFQVGEEYPVPGHQKLTKKMKLVNE